MDCAPPAAEAPESLAPISGTGRVLVAMSGGVDSSVVAALLHRQGVEVVGVSMRLYGTVEASNGKSCCSPDDLYDARQVSQTFGFPYYVANYQERFRELVIASFVDAYRRGQTPSPCVLCNDHLKFDALLTRMLNLGADALATGHYARIEMRDGRPALLRGRDAKKDQSYFLFGLPREQLGNIQFPLGHLTKPEVRKLAEELGVPTAHKPESQDICFVGNGDYAAFVRERLKDEEVRPGPFVHTRTGALLGQHDGIHQFTVGQRKGLRIAHSEPLYVTGIDPDTGTVFVGEVETLASATMRIERCNWLRWPEPPGPFEALVQVRYRHSPVPAVVEPDADNPRVATVRFAAPERAIAPGQAAVCYEGDEVLGGGWIVRAC